MFDEVGGIETGLKSFDSVGCDIVFGWADSNGFQFFP